MKRMTWAEVEAHNAKVYAGRVKSVAGEEPVADSAKAACLAPNLHENNSKTQSPFAKPSVCHESLGATKGKTENSTRCKVSIVSFRKRLLDLDNLYGGVKYFVDALRYEGLIPNDDPNSIELLVSQIKSKDERTEIEIDNPSV